MQRNRSFEIAMGSERPAIASRWMGLIRDFCRRLGRGDAVDVGGAMSHVVAGLPVKTATVFRLDVEVPVIVGSCGEPESRHADRLRTAWKLGRDRGNGVFFSEPEITGVAVADLGMVLSGDFPSRLRCRPLLETLLTMLQGVVADDPRAPAVNSRRGDLVFAPEYVVGISPAARRLHQQMEPLVDSDLSVLIVGETGVGKELVARSLHLSSPRFQHPLVAINCAAIPAELLEAELFGIRERVASGVAGRRGRFQQAAGGTLLLDEIADMPVELQSKLLRVLGERTVWPVGGSPEPIDVRLVAATNADVLQQIERGRFRRDLYYRLAGCVLQVPPLRQRRDDIPLLAEHFVRSTSQQLGKAIKGMTCGAMRLLVEHRWSGNVREIEHCVRHLVHCCRSYGVIASRQVADLLSMSRSTRQETGDGESPHRPAIDSDRTLRAHQQLDIPSFEREAIREALLRESGNQVRAAKLLGISRYRLRRRIERYGFDRVS